MSTIHVTASDIGRRVVVRHRLPDGRATDVVGDLLALEPGALAVLPDSGPPVRLQLADVVAAKPVPPRRVLPSSSPDALERVMAQGWPGLEARRLGGWLLRAAGGFSRRANSALAAGDPGVPLDDAVDAVRTFYTERGLAPSVQVAVPLPGDRRWPDCGTLASLEARGWVRDDPTEVMVLDLRRRVADAPALPAGATLHWDDEPDDAWLALYRYHGSALPEVARRVLLAARQQAFASIRSDGDTVAVGRVAVASAWVGITAMQVAPEHRRRGLARVLLDAMLSRGARDGARFAYLQVLAGNAPAISLYSSTGFVPHHAYHYLTPPG